MATGPCYGAVAAMSSRTYELQSDLPKSIFGYDVLEYLGEGAASVIYAVSDPKTRQLYALKYVVRKTEKHDRFIDQLESEFQVGRAVRHPGLRRIIDLKINRTLLRRVTDAALIMELFDGEPLENRRPRTILETMDRFIRSAKRWGRCMMPAMSIATSSPTTFCLAPRGHESD